MQYKLILAGTTDGKVFQLSVTVDNWGNLLLLAHGHSKDDCKIQPYVPGTGLGPL